MDCLPGRGRGLCAYVYSNTVTHHWVILSSICQHAWSVTYGLISVIKESVMIAQWDSSLSLRSVARVQFPATAEILRDFSLTDHTLPALSQCGGKWLNGTTQPVDIEEEGRRPTTDRRWLIEQNLKIKDCRRQWHSCTGTDINPSFQPFAHWYEYASLRPEKTTRIRIFTRIFEPAWTSEVPKSRVAYSTRVYTRINLSQQPAVRY